MKASPLSVFNSVCVRLGWSLLLLFAVGACSASTHKGKEITLSEVHEGKLAAGDEWQYKTRPGEDASTLTVLRVESSGTERIVHVRVNGVRIKNPTAPSGFSHELGHLPFLEQRVLDSVTRRIRQGIEVSGMLDGYNTWKEAFLKGKAGIFTLSVAEAVTGVEEGLNK
ncbi:hypothetical protein KKD52_13065 [Myxococcota bacterium]|nr:hypothetical protein [Myxococcota bacterium]MBU1412644.1 hypothetical protein [Myxococcota bacterium]MBU1511284.1 hypothetical protein [Myxococcota bacterium]